MPVTRSHLNFEAALQELELRLVRSVLMRFPPPLLFDPGHFRAIVGDGPKLFRLLGGYARLDVVFAMCLAGLAMLWSVTKKAINTSGRSCRKVPLMTHRRAIEKH